MATGCATAAELQFMGIIYSKNRQQIDLKNMNEPVKFYWTNDDFLTFNSGQCQLYFETMMNTTI